MRVISWNMRRATVGSAAWSYFDQLDPDVALLQEVNGVPAAIQKRFTTLHQPARGETGNDQKFGTAVLVRGERVGDLNLTSPHEWTIQQLRDFSGNLVSGVYRTNANANSRRVRLVIA